MHIFHAFTRGLEYIHIMDKNNNLLLRSFCQLYNLRCGNKYNYCFSARLRSSLTLLLSTGNNCDMGTFFAVLARSQAMSTAELPMPATWQIKQRVIQLISSHMKEKGLI